MKEFKSLVFPCKKVHFGSSFLPSHTIFLTSFSFYSLVLYRLEMLFRVMIHSFLFVIYQTLKTVSGCTSFPNTEERVESTGRSGVFSTNYGVWKCGQPLS